MISELIAAVLAIGLAGYAEWRHYKSGNGKRFEQVHILLNSDRGE